MEIPRSDAIDPEKINPHDLLYQCYKHGPDCLSGKLRAKDYNDEPRFPNKKRTNFKSNSNEYVV